MDFLLVLGLIKLFSLGVTTEALQANIAAFFDCIPLFRRAREVTLPLIVRVAHLLTKIFLISYPVIGS